MRHVKIRMLGSTQSILGIVCSSKKEELEQLEKMDNSSASCKEFLDSVDISLILFFPSNPNSVLHSPFHTVRSFILIDLKAFVTTCRTTGPVNATWDQWFEGPKEAKRCGCSIL
ncbi:hypothetical protein EUTSA_v10022265mg [Eutrema salsugineum]|uniref:Guanine nucleotide-binding protein subunit gamma n=1 Tax=Eutrema salsugineum TaxID=72664 RepID=V4NMD0_EUTSA|nr:hypothetical protein EUTSA_v10022265mg [Eutrema salsugineum]